MTSASARRSATEELARIDFLLNELARAVERGEVPRASYDTLAPRYLARRESLVALLMGVAPARAVQPSVQSAHASLAPGTLGAPQGAAPAGYRAGPTQPSKPRPARTPVRWTTVLLFLGAFLVIVASGIFAAAVWDITGPGFRLAFLGTLTVAFYAAGYYTRTKLQLRAGGTALTVVASAMLLFDCWIVIDGFGLTGPLPWAVAMLLCSAVYWLTEVALGERFYGVVGAAAQIGWWWLLGSGIGVVVPVRIAGIAVVAVVWQLTAERVAKGSATESLALVLEWAAPVVQAVAVAAIFVNLVYIGSPDPTLILSAAVVAGCSAFVAMRTTHMPKGRSVAAAIAQVPFLLTVVEPTSLTQWWMVLLLAAATAVYAAASLLGAGTAFAVIALAAEFSLVGLVGQLLPAMSDAIGTVVYATLAVSWVAAALITERAADTAAAERLPGARAFATSSGIGGVALLIVSTVMALTSVDAIPMGSVTISGTDAALTAAVLLAWVASSALRRRPVFAVGTALWSYFTLATVLAWASPTLDAGWAYVALLALAGIWLSARHSLSRWFDVPAEAFAWATRTIAILLVLAGVLSGVASDGFGTWPSAAVAAAGALLFLGDALLSSQTASAAIAGVFSVAAAMIAGGAIASGNSETYADAVRLGSGPWGYEAVAAATGALVLCTAAAALRRRFPDQVSAFALAAAGTASLACAAAMGDARSLSLSLALVAGAWMIVAFVSDWDWLAGVGGLFLFGSAASLLAAEQAAPWATVLVFVALAGVLNALGLTRAFGPAGPARRAGWSLAIAGLAGLAALAVSALVSGQDVGLGLSGASWADIGWHGEAFVLAVLGGLMIGQARRYRVEPGLYVGCAVLVLSAVSEFRAFGLTNAELYSTLLALYTIGMGYLYSWQRPGRRVPMVTDVVGILILLWTPLAASLTTPPGPELFVHTAWAIGLSLVAIAAGIGLRVRAYLYGGAAAIALVALWRTASYLAEFWWVVLGVIGVAMLVIALTWERQRMLLSDTQRRLRDRFETWR